MKKQHVILFFAAVIPFLCNYFLHMLLAWQLPAADFATAQRWLSWLMVALAGGMGIQGWASLGGTIPQIYRHWRVLAFFVFLFSYLFDFGLGYWFVALLGGYFLSYERGKLITKAHLGGLFWHMSLEPIFKVIIFLLVSSFLPSLVSLYMAVGGAMFLVPSYWVVFRPKSPKNSK